MTVAVNEVRARSMGRSFTLDPELSLPERPRIIPELLICPCGRDGLLYAGAAKTEVIRGRSARRLLPRLLGLLDGTRTLDAIGMELSGVPPDDLHDAVSLLFSRGLLEDGPGTDVECSTPEVVSFLGRHVDVSRCNRSRGEATARLARAAVQVHAPPHLRGLACQQLADAGFRVEDGETAVAGPDALSLVVSTGDAPVSAGDVEARLRGGGSVLLLRLGAAEAHIGPLLVAGVTVCPGCVMRVHPHPPGAPKPLYAELWVSLSVQLVLLEITRLAPSIVHRGFHRVTRDESGALAQDARVTPRMPGCASCGIAGDAWPPDDPRLLAWIYHAGSALTRRSTLAPKEHQAHYLAANVNLGVARRELLYVASPAPLPDPIELPARPGLAAPGTTRLDLGGLSALLARTAGEIGHGAKRRRIVPTGGNLGSVRLWVLARTVDGLERGAYLYEPLDHSLRFMANFDDDALHTGLATWAPLPACVLVGAGDLAKCSRKYHGFAYRLVHFDAGVALAYAHTVARTIGLTVREYADARLDLPRMFAVPRRWEFPATTFAVGIGADPLVREPAAPARPPPPEPSLVPEDYALQVVARMLDAAARDVPPTPWQRGRAAAPQDLPPPLVRSLDEVLVARRASRAFSPERPAQAVLRALVSAAEQAIAAREAAGAAMSFVRPLLLVVDHVDGLPAGVYERAGDGTDTLVRRAAFGRRRAADCTLQLALAAAPAGLVMVANLRAALTRRHTRGYCDQALHAGAAVGAAWLAATSYGLVGTAAGGVIPDGLRSVAGLDGFNDCPLLGLHVGLPA